MKKIIKSVPVFLTVIMIFCCSLFVPAFAASDVDGVNLLWGHTDYFTVQDGVLAYCNGAYSYEYLLPVGTYRFTYSMSGDFSTREEFSKDWILLKQDPDSLHNEPLDFSSDCVFAVTEDMLYFDSEDPDFGGFCLVVINSYMVEPVVTVYNEPVVDAPSGESPVVSILDVWAKILAWMAEAFDRLSLVFYSADTGLTFIGYLAVGVLAVAVVFLLFGLVRKWLRFGR